MPSPVASDHPQAMSAKRIDSDACRHLPIPLKTNTHGYSLSRIPAASVLSSRRGMKPTPNSILYATSCNIPSRNRFGLPAPRRPQQPALSPIGFAFLASIDSKGLVASFVQKGPRPSRTILHHSAPSCTTQPRHRGHEAGGKRAPQFRPQSALPLLDTTTWALFVPERQASGPVGNTTPAPAPGGRRPPPSATMALQQRRRP